MGGRIDEFDGWVGGWRLNKKRATAAATSVPERGM